ncbi:aspartyl-phosphate phosphatase Spo0E family protein [Peribacillus cavernae]|uniref:Aspartyl-phosphate phosphatase Spo0E family protein n=1 Tax=Peribacillus cavernae TaxID=1674310 RepID=A0A3S0VE51_9BACI|nr:aspartyl-phosphate phosphatase Spo0E family protein [Peribacillus cavernae]MDQ0217351.1 hypothetical protein [Peribacillus cavernae]RUQ30197.1 aspartyl-phosphate phosphatase Spo0E family protein [Peribacillus cavernae]
MIATKSRQGAIEKKRQEMIDLADAFGYTNPDTIKASQELDKLMNAIVLDRRSFRFS